MPNPGQISTPRFLSLKWKAVLVFSSVLITINASLAGLAYLGLQRQFTQQREQIYQSNVQQIQGLAENSYWRMEQLADIIPLLRGDDDADSGSLVERIQSILNQHWRLLQMIWGVETVRFYSSDNRLLVFWKEQGDADQALQWVETANKTEQPVTALFCMVRCMQYVAVPLLSGEERAGVLLLGRSLADIVLAFRRISGDDIGVIITRESYSGDAAKSRRLLPGWNMRVTAMTNAGRNLLILRSISESYSLEAVAHQPVLHHYAGREYEVRLMSLDASIGEDSPARLVVISDVTRAISDIEAETRKILLVGLVGLIASEVLLLLLLWTPMSRLRRVALSLPLLAEHAFEKIRDHLSYPAPIWGGRDEIDVLNSTAITLSYQLEALQTEIRERAHHLAERGDELARERDFVTGLLNTAQAVILTQDAAGQVVMVNRQGRILTGYNAEEITGRPFSGILADDQASFIMLQELEKLRCGERDHVNMDAMLQCKDSSQRTITWSHSRLIVHSPADVLILSVGHDVTEREQAEQQIAWLADHDPLTELFNRRRFQNEFEQILMVSSRYQHSGALLYFDLDQFKYINDTSGHQAGDALLQVVADKLRQMVRASDVVARLGGDEFAVIIRECDAEGAILAAKKICAQLSALEFPFRDRNHSVSTSIGIALFPLHGLTTHELMANADLAMYQAKGEGRGRWHLFSSNERAREQMQNRVYWKEQIEQALREDRFLLYFQPVLNIHTNTIGHYEVLLRMRDHRGKIISPGQFIPIAEQIGLIHLIDHLVIHKAIAEQVRLNARGYRLTLSINLSGRVVDDPGLLPLLTKLLRTSTINPSSLMFEVTETAAVVDMAAAENLMRGIKALGCRFALDDFGVGFSSFFYLKRLPVDYVKIDGMFVRHLATNHQDRIFVKALNDIAKGLGKEVVAEFVENEEILTLLREYDVDYAQGYYIGRPAPEITEVRCAQGKIAWPQTKTG